MENLKRILSQNKLKLFSLSRSTATAQQAADALGCRLAQIGKSICFWVDDRPVLVIASGINKIDEKKVASLLGSETVRIMKAREVKEITGFEVGGVPPFGHKQKLMTIIDKTLLRFPFIWVAGGGRHNLFKITPQELQRISQGQIADIAR